MSEALDQLKSEIDDFINYVKERFSIDEMEVTLFARNKSVKGRDLLMTTGEFEEIVTPLREFLETNGVSSSRYNPQPLIGEE